MINSMKSVATAPPVRSAIVIPTLNRHAYVNELLENISKLSPQPVIVVVVDASKDVYVSNHKTSNVKVVASTIRSAAVQRNIGIRYLSELNLDLDYLAFLDDDVRVLPDYLQLIHANFRDFPQAIGLSGIAISKNERKLRTRKFWSFIGLSGKEGALTKAAINIPVRNATSQVEVDWLIGCSVWRWKFAQRLIFQSDFMGQSVFEDVLFSVEASNFGKLIVDPQIVITHLLADEERPNNMNHYRSWVVNRYRLKRVAPERFSLLTFLTANFVVAIKLIVSLRVKGAFGILLGTIQLLGQS